MGASSEVHLGPEVNYRGIFLLCFGFRGSAVNSPTSTSIAAPDGMQLFVSSLLN
jgi:hypothetical protein